MTPKQRRLVEEYLIDLNATQAARRAGYGERWACHQGCRLLRNRNVAAAIAKAQVERAERTRVTADQVVTELAKVAFGDPRKLLSWGPKGVVLRESAELTEAEAALVSEVAETRTSTGGTRRVKLHCKLTALTALGRHLGLFAGGGLAAANRVPDGEGHGHDGSAETDSARERLARRIAGIAARLDPSRAAE